MLLRDMSLSISVSQSEVCIALHLYKLLLVSREQTSGEKAILKTIWFSQGA